jgi:hypothetical protein
VPSGALVISFLIGAAPMASVDVSELADRAERAASLAREAAAAPSPEALDEVRAVLGLPTSVRIGVRTVTLPADPFLASLDGDSGRDFMAAATRLEVLADTYRSTMLVEGVDREELRRDIEAAYGRAIDAEPGFWERVERAIASFLEGAFREAGETLGRPGAWIVIVGLLLGTALALRRLGVRPVPEAVARGEPHRRVDWRKQADAARARGDLAATLGWLYAGMVEALASRGVVEDRPSLTTGEVRRSNAAGELSGLVSEATTRYERIRYGLAPPTEDDVDALESAARGVRP